MEYALLVAVIAGVTELITRVRASDWWVVVTIVCAALVGGVFGFFHVYGLDVLSGIVAGLSTSGVVTIVGTVKSAASKSSPSSPVKK